MSVRSECDRRSLSYQSRLIFIAVTSIFFAEMFSRRKRKLMGMRERDRELESVRERARESESGRESKRVSE